MFTAALFTEAKTQKQTKRPSTDERIKRMWYVYLQWKFVATRTDLEIILLSEVSQTGRDKYQMISIIFGILFFLNDTNELIYKTETVLQILKINLWLPKGKQGREG